MTDEIEQPQSGIDDIEDAGEGDWVTPVPPTGTPAYAVMPWRLFLRLRNLAAQASAGQESGADISIRSAGGIALLTALDQDNPFDSEDSETLPDDGGLANDENMPLAVLDRLLDGEHPLKVFRRYRGLSQKELAERTGLNATYLSQIETRKRGGSTRVYRLLAAALNVDIGDLIE